MKIFKNFFKRHGIIRLIVDGLFIGLLGPLSELFSDFPNKEVFTTIIYILDVLIEIDIVICLICLFIKFVSFVSNSDDE